MWSYRKVGPNYQVGTYLRVTEKVGPNYQVGIEKWVPTLR
jgi:hypothetical protein